MLIFFCSLLVVFAIFEISSRLKERSVTSDYSRVQTNEAISEMELAELKTAGREPEVEHAGAVRTTPPEHKAAGEGNAEHLESFTMTPSSIRTLLKSGTQLGVILLYSWWCENAPLFPHASKHGNFDTFWFLALVFLGVSCLHVAPSINSDILNRDQTEEWKGWMQYIFLAYHYFHFEDVYNSVRVFISCYVWMTGFGNFSFFYMKGDFSWIRWWNMMWRLNFLVFFLCLVHNNTYILYYICPLHTFYFNLVYLSMRLLAKYNVSKWAIRVKMIVLALILFVIWDIPGVFNFVFGFLSTEPTLGATGGTLKEWHFRSGLDHWSSFFGMIFALNFPMYQGWLKKVEKELGMKSQFLVKGSVVLVLLGGFAVYCSFYPKPKLEYNEYHPYIFQLPLLAYVFIRNLSPRLRAYHLHYMAEMGKTTLETYLMQHHIWLTSNAKTLLVLVPASPLINLFATTFIYVLISRSLYRLTLNLRAQLIPKEAKESFKFLAIMITSIMAAFMLAVLVSSMEASAWAVAVVSLLAAVVVCGIVKLSANHSTQANILLGIILFLSVAVCAFYFTRSEAVSMTSSPRPSPAPGSKTGVASNVGLGVLMLVVAGLMLVFFDNFCGLLPLALKIFGGGVGLSFEEAYEKLNANILRNRP